jgi:hypothetical protein
MEHTLACLWSPMFSLDGRYLYFLSGAWATSSALHRINAETGREEFIAPANDFVVMDRGRWRGNLLVWQHRYYPDEARDGVWLLAPEGRTLLRVTFETDPGAEARVAAARAGRIP